MTATSTSSGLDLSDSTDVSTIEWGEDVIPPQIVHLGGPDDWWNVNEADRGTFPSTTSYRAERFYGKHGKSMQIYSYGHLVIEFIETNLVLSDAEYTGMPFDLMMWQKRMILELYEVTPRVNHITGQWEWVRIHRWGLIGIPKKNGKTELAAALGLFHLYGDGENAPNVLCAASSEDQAELVFGAATRMCEHEDSMLTEYAKCTPRKITSAHNNGQLVKVAAASGTNDGKNVSVTLIDELHEWIKPNARAIFTVLTQGGGARRQPLNLMITTAGHEQDSTCYELYEHGGMVRDGAIEDKGFYFCWFEAPEDADYRDPETWRLANPSWGLILQQEFYEDIITKRSESEFRRYFLNQWTEAEEIWEAAALWDALVGSVKFDPSRKTFVAVDVGRRHDTCAVVITQYDELTGKVLYSQKIWANPYKKIDSGYSKWTMNIADIEKLLLELYDAYPVPSALDEDESYLVSGPAFFYDPHFFSRSAEMLIEAGLNMREVPQTDNRMVPCSQRFFEIIKTSMLTHDGDPVMRKHIRSVVPKERERGWRIAKMGSTKAIDGAIAGAIAVFYCTEGIDDGSELAPNIW